MFRYIAVIWDENALAQEGRARTIAQRILSLSDRSWHRVFDANGIHVYCAHADTHGGRVHCLPDGQGVILGRLFARRSELSGKRSPEEISTSEAHEIVRSSGARLISHYWGRYVAFLFDRSTSAKILLKDPTGRLPCFRCSIDGVQLIFSCFADCVNAGLLTPRVDWYQIALRVGRARSAWGGTALDGITEIIGGSAVTFSSGRTETRYLWSPESIAQSEPLEDATEAARQLRVAVLSATEAWTCGHDAVICRTSGGLDSSIVLAALRSHDGGPRVTCLNYRTDGCSKGQRFWPVLAARHFGFHLVTRSCKVYVPFEALQRMNPLPNPPPDYSWAISGDFELELAAKTGSTGVITGDGGDPIFGRYSEDFACIDYFRQHGFDGKLLSIAADVALLRNRSAWSVVYEALSYNSQRIRSEDFQRMRRGRSLVNDDIFEMANSGAIPPHPWFRTIARSAASDAVEMVAQTDLFYHPLRSPSATDLEPLYPLCSQPVVELCLRIPSYTLMHGGLSRGLAREAFKTDLPREIFSRQWKDAGQSLAYQLIYESGAAIREFLLDGVLVQKGYLNRERLERSLSDAPSKQTAVINEMTDHVIVEAWLRQWV